MMNQILVDHKKYQVLQTVRNGKGDKLDVDKLKLTPVDLKNQVIYLKRKLFKNQNIIQITKVQTKLKQRTLKIKYRCLRIGY